MDEKDKELLIKLLSEPSGTVKTKEPPYYIKESAEYLEKLKKRKTALGEKYQFKEGDIIIWKDGLKNKRLPEYGQPCIVIEIFKQPLKDEDEIYEAESLDIKAGFIDEDDEFLVFCYDSNRFTLQSKG